MKNICKLMCLLIFTALLLALLAGCSDYARSRSVEVVRFSSFYDVPGLTKSDIKAVEEILARTDSFTFGMLNSTSAFVDQSNGNNGIRGYSALMCEWLTELFGVPFVLQHFTWNEVLAGLDDGTIDFTGTMTPTPVRREAYFMTDPIAQRTIKYFHINGAVRDEERLPRYALLRDAVSTQSILKYKIYDFEAVFIDEYIQAHSLMLAGEIDALLAESTVEAVFDEFHDVAVTPFLPSLYTPVSMTAKNPELEPIIKVVQKVLENGGKHYLDGLYDTGNQEYLRHKLFLQLTDEEKNYIKNNPVIPFGAEYANYPISFYNSRNNEWQGIAFDVLKEVEFLTGLKFEHNDGQIQFYDLLEMLKSGQIYMVTEVLQTPEREGIFIWPDNPLMIDRSVLISKVTYPNINTNKVYSARVGLSQGSAYAEFFFTWFPNHENYVMYPSQQATFEALTNGEVDLVMNSYSTLLNFTNYQELPDYKANIIFDNDYSSTFGINKDQVILCSIIDKSLALIDTDVFSEYWKNRTYDYQLRLMQAQRPWIIGAAVLLLCVLILVAVLWARSHHTGRKLEKLVEERTRELEIANKAKSSFLANMSHEIRTPMNAILGITEILIQHKDLSEEIEIGLCKIYSSCDMLLGIINDILDFSKIEAGKLDITPAPYLISSLINDSIQLNLMKIGSKHIDFELVIDENIPAKLIGDELRIKQILNNLLSNAFKYTDTGKVILSVSFSPVPEESRAVLSLSVKDSGQGMSKEQLEKLFDEYARFNYGANISVEGTGLGLAITQRLIILMDGEIHVESELGIGSLFTVSFSQGVVDDKILGKEVAENLRQFRLENLAYNIRGQVKRESMPYGSVLIVDDVETNLFVAAGLLRPYDLQVESVLSGFEAIEKIKQGKTYDIVFMDHMMPGMDGIEATEKLRELGYHKPIVALTANAVAGQADMFLDNGFDNFVSKPIDVRQLNAVLNKYIRDKHPQNASKDVKPPGEVSRSQFSDKNIEGLDIKKGLKKFDNDEGIYLKILHSFIASMRDIIGRIEKMGEINQENLKDYRISVHSIKGSGYDIFADSIAEIAKSLEEAAIDGNLEFINQKTSSFVQLTQGFIRDLENMVSAIDSENPKLEKDSPDTQILAELLEACKMFDIAGAETALESLEVFSYTADDGLVGWLREQLDMMNFIEIVEKLSQNELIN
jgi:signal transduction histidine kinase/CheY-like chemotaxis protein/HPt (histidine-containing phosphotransfer) domain-containing protein